MNFYNKILVSLVISLTCFMPDINSQNIRKRYDDKDKYILVRIDDIETFRFHHNIKPISKEKFDILSIKIKDKSFSKDKFDLIEVAGMFGYFSCAQCYKLMNLFSFDDDKIRVVELLANNLTDKENYSILADALTFGSKKELINRLFIDEEESAGFRKW